MRNRYRRYRLLSMILLWMAIAFVNAVKSAAQTTCVGFSSFQSLTTQQLTTLQVRVVPVGVLSDEAEPALAFTYFSNPLTPASFKTCEAPKMNFTSDLVAPKSFTVGTSDLQTFLTNAATIPAVVAGGVSPSPFYALEMYASQPSQMGFEVVLDKPTSATLFTVLENTFAGQPQALTLIAEQACKPGFLPAGTPNDVSASVPVKLQSVRLKRDTGTYVGNLTITNNSGGALATPLSVVVVPGGHSVFLAHPDGITCGTSPIGRGFISIVTPPAAGNSTSVPIEFTNPDNETISISHVVVLSGPGGR